MLAGEPRKVGHAFGVRAMTGHAGGNSPLRNALVEELLALYDKCRVTRASKRGRLVRIIRCDAGDNRFVQIARDPPHEIVSILFRTGLLAKSIDLALEVASALRREYRELGRRADASGPVTGRAEIHRFFLARLPDVRRNLRRRTLRPAGKRQARQRGKNHNRADAIHSRSPQSTLAAVAARSRREGKGFRTRPIH